MPFPITEQCSARYTEFIAHRINIQFLSEMCINVNRGFKKKLPLVFPAADRIAGQTFPYIHKAFANQFKRHHIQMICDIKIIFFRNQIIDLIQQIFYSGSNYKGITAGREFADVFPEKFFVLHLISQNKYISDFVFRQRFQIVCSVSNPNMGCHVQGLFPVAKKSAQSPDRGQFKTKFQILIFICKKQFSFAPVVNDTDQRGKRSKTACSIFQ